MEYLFSDYSLRRRLRLQVAMSQMEYMQLHALEPRTKAPEGIGRKGVRNPSRQCHRNFWWQWQWQWLILVLG
jgi:hypothetical protein